MMYSRTFILVACSLLWGSTQAGAPARDSSTALGTVQLSYVDPADVTVNLSGPGDFAREVQVTGGQVFTELQPGTYELTLSKEGYRTFSETLEVVAGQTSATEVTLEPQVGEQALDNPGTLQLTWVDPGEVVVRVSGPDGYAEEVTVTGGQVFSGLGAGTYEVALSKEGYQSTTQTIDVTANQTSSLSVVLKERAGAPQSGAAASEAEEASEEPEPAAELSLAELLEQGSALYVQSGCSGCHGGDGGGNQGPGFVGNEDLADTEFVAGILVGGNGGMPSFGARLSDEEIAAVASYIRNAWGNDYGAVSPSDVATQR